MNVSLHQFALITSKMHMAWTAMVGGRLKSDYQYSPGINYNPFPWPATFTDRQKFHLDALAQAVLDARSEHPGASLGDLYEFTGCHANKSAKERITAIDSPLIACIARRRSVATGSGSNTSSVFTKSVSPPSPPWRQPNQSVARGLDPRIS